DLVGMDAHLCSEPVASRLAALPLETGDVSEIGIDGIDRLDACGARADEAKRPRQEIRLGRVAGVVAIGMSTKRGCEIFHAPGDAEEPLACLGIGAKMKERRR